MGSSSMAGGAPDNLEDASRNHSQSYEPDGV